MRNKPSLILKHMINGELSKPFPHKITHSLETACGQWEETWNEWSWEVVFVKI